MSRKTKGVADEREIDKLILTRDILSARIKSCADAKTRSRLTREKQKLSDRILEALEAHMA